MQQIAASIATRLRTADAAKIDDALIMDIEHSLMKLSDAISAAYLTNNERSEFRLGGAGMIYDVRQTTTCTYASPVAHARHVLRLTPVSPRRRAGACRLAADRRPSRRSRRESKDFFGNRLDLDRDRRSRTTR